MQAKASTAPQKLSTLVWVCVALLAVIGPLTVPKPGVPGSLKADEPTYYLMALSIWYDGDLTCENRDVERLFREFPTRADDLLLSSTDGWETARFSSPFVYSILAAPIAGLFGANGMVSLNCVLALAMIAMAIAYLKRFPLDVLKIDRSYVSGVLGEGNDVDEAMRRVYGDDYAGMCRAWQRRNTR